MSIENPILNNFTQEEEKKFDTSEKKESDFEEKNITLEKFLDKVDFNTLRMIFEDYLRKSGISPEKFNFLGPEKIKYMKGWDAAFFADNSIRMNTDVGKNLLMAINTGLAPDLLNLHKLIHEEVHAISHNSRMEHSPTEAEYRSGYQKTKTIFTDIGNDTVQVDNSHFFRLFDEAVTERLAREITVRYLEKYPNFTNNASKYIYKNINNHPGADIYQPEVDLLEALITRLSVETELSEELIWQGIIRSKMEGFSFYEDNMHELFDELVGKDFTNRLKSVNTLKGLRGLTNMIEEVHGISPTFKQRLIRKTRDILTSKKDRTLPNE